MVGVAVVVVVGVGVAVVVGVVVVVGVAVVVAVAVGVGVAVVVDMNTPDKITLTRKAWDRWTKRYNLIVNSLAWEALVEEASRREPIEAWAVVFKTGHQIYINETIARAEADSEGGRIVKLREVEGE